MDRAHPFRSKGIFAWQIPSTLNGDPAAIAHLLQVAGFESVSVKVADGGYPFSAGGQENCSLALVDALHDLGIAVVGWGFLYGADWKGEAQIAATQVNRYGLDGYIWDVESQYEATPGAAANASNILATFKNSVARPTPTAFCSWAYFKNPTSGSEWHPLAVAKAWMEGCDYGLPMEYWQGTSGAASYLALSLAQWRKYVTDKPLIPIGRAYNGDGGQATPDQMTIFEAQARSESCPGISWWELDQCQPHFHADWWVALSDMEKFGAASTPDPDPTEEIHSLEFHYKTGNGEGAPLQHRFMEALGTIDYIRLDNFRFNAAILAPEPPPQPPTPPEPPAPPPDTDEAISLTHTTVTLLHAGQPDEITYHVLSADPREYELVVDDHLAMIYPHQFLTQNHLEFATNGGAGWYSLTVLKKRVFTYIYGLSLFRGKGFGKLDKNWGQIYVDENGVLDLAKPKTINTTFPFTNLLIYNDVLPPIDKQVDYRARLAIGQRTDGRMIILYTEGGDYNKANGLSFQEVQQLMKELDCIFAVMVDGGGSACMSGLNADGSVYIVGTPSGEQSVTLNGILYHIRPTAGHMGLKRKAT